MGPPIIVTVGIQYVSVPIPVGMESYSDKVCMRCLKLSADLLLLAIVDYSVVFDVRLRCVKHSADFFSLDNF